MKFFNGNKYDFISTKDTESIRSNLRVAQNGRFAMNTIYLVSGNMVAKGLDFRLSESLKMRSPGPFALLNYPKKVEFCMVFARTFLDIFLYIY